MVADVLKIFGQGSGRIFVKKTLYVFWLTGILFPGIINNGMRILNVGIYM